METKTITKFWAELFGTLVLVLMGCGSAVIAGANGTSGVGLLGIAFAFGLSVVAMAYAIGHISGCHINPAISIGMVTAGRMKMSEAWVYIAAQIIGVEIPFGENNLRITYSLPYYRQAKIRYQYYLEGYSRQWSDWSAQTQNEFTNLGQGTYKFKVRARINDGVVSPVTEFSFTILAPWYAGTIAMFCYALLVVLLYYGVRYYYRLKLRKHQLHLQQKLQHEKEEFLKQEAIKREQQLVKLRNEQLQTDLASKSRELANSAMNIVYKNELLQKISSEILQLKDANGKRLSEEQLRRIQKVIDEGMSDDRDWNIFETSFNEAHENFFKKLKAQHPDLVPNDLKLCAYLRMNMSSKEMASLLNITLRGVEIRRYRLRKKLNLEHDKNLVEFLMEL
jgi:DNA-binding CsgD family transcriptional regulator